MSNTFDISLYNDDFFKWHSEHAHEYSVRNMEWLLGSPYVNEPKSVLDIGCGIGSYLSVAIKHGLDILGFEIALDKALPYMDKDVIMKVHQWDCTQPLLNSYHWKSSPFDIVMSFETAEHIEPSGTGVFMDNLAESLAIGGLLLFTGAPPGQEGCGHINCRPKNEWIRMFEDRGLERLRHAEEAISNAWLEQGCPNYIAQNLISMTRPAYFKPVKRK